MFFVYKKKVLKMPTNNLKELYIKIYLLSEINLQCHSRRKRRKKNYLSFYFNDKKEFMLTFL